MDDYIIQEQKMDRDIECNMDISNHKLDTNFRFQCGMWVNRHIRGTFSRKRLLCVNDILKLDSEDIALAQYDMSHLKYLHYWIKLSENHLHIEISYDGMNIRVYLCMCIECLYDLINRSNNTLFNIFNLHCFDNVLHDYQTSQMKEREIQTSEWDDYVEFYASSNTITPHTFKKDCIPLPITQGFQPLYLTETGWSNAPKTSTIYANIHNIHCVYMNSIIRDITTKIDHNIDIQQPFESKATFIVLSRQYSYLYTGLVNMLKQFIPISKIHKWSKLLTEKTIREAHVIIYVDPLNVKSKLDPGLNNIYTYTEFEKMPEYITFMRNNKSLYKFDKLPFFLWKWNHVIYAHKQEHMYIDFVPIYDSIIWNVYVGSSSMYDKILGNHFIRECNNYLASTEVLYINNIQDIISNIVKIDSTIYTIQGYENFYQLLQNYIHSLPYRGAVYFQLVKYLEFDPFLYIKTRALTTFSTDKPFHIKQFNELKESPPECCICMENRCDTALCTCGHLFCFKCILCHSVQQIHSKYMKCPICKMDNTYIYNTNIHIFEQFEQQYSYAINIYNQLHHNQPQHCTVILTFDSMYINAKYICDVLQCYTDVPCVPLSNRISALKSDMIYVSSYDNFKYIKHPISNINFIFLNIPTYDVFIKFITSLNEPPHGLYFIAHNNAYFTNDYNHLKKIYQTIKHE